MPTPVIDMWAPILPVPEVMAHVAENFPDAMLGYLRVFWKQRPSEDALRAGAPAMARPLSEVVATLDAAGITRTLVTGFDERSTAGRTFIPNALVAPIAERHPDRFIPFAGADVMKGLAALRELEHWVRERGFRGLSLRPFMIGLPADDRRYYPFYAKCVELGIPLSIHTSANWTSVAVNDLGHPRHLDPVDGRPVGRGVDAERDAELHALRVEGVVAPVVGGQANHERPQREPMEAALAHPVLELAERREALHDVHARERNEAIRMARGDRCDQRVRDEGLPRG